MSKLAGQRFGKLVATEPVGLEYDGKSLWFCLCDCGVVIVILVRDLVHVRSCGCE